MIDLKRLGVRLRELLLEIGAAENSWSYKSSRTPTAALDQVTKLVSHGLVTRISAHTFRLTEQGREVLQTIMKGNL